MNLTEIPRFIGSKRNIDEADIVLAGFPYDCTASFRAGSRFAPRHVRNYSFEAIEEFSFHLEKSLDDISFFDAGDMEIMVGNPEKMVQKIKAVAFDFLSSGKKLLAIGGEHLVTFPLFLASSEVFGDFTVLHLDAHADLRDSYGDDVLSHASVMKLCLDNGLNRLIQFGIRSGTKDEFLLRKNDKRIFVADNLKMLSNLIQNKEKIYLTVDVDFFDPSEMPGTGTPEAGGAKFNDFIDILKVLEDKEVEIVSADVVELAPEIDSTGISTAFTAKLIREILLSL